MPRRLGVTITGQPESTGHGRHVSLDVSQQQGAFGFARGVGLTGGASALLLELHASSESLSSSGKAQQQACEALRPTGAVAVALTHTLD